MNIGPKLVQYLSYGSRTVQPPIMSTLLIFYQFNRPWKSFLWVLSLQFPRFLGSLSLHPWKSSYCRPFCRVLLTGLPRVSRAVRPAERSDKGRRGRHKVRPGVTHSPRATPDRSHVLRTGPGPWHEWDGEWVAIKITFVYAHHLLSTHGLRPKEDKEVNNEVMMTVAGYVRVGKGMYEGYGRG